MIRNSRRRESSFLYYYWIPIVLIIIGSFVLWNYVITAINAVKNHEKIDIFIECQSADYEYGKKIENDLMTSCDGLIEANVYSFDEDDDNIYDYYQKFGVYSDLLIVNDDDLKDTDSYVHENYLDLSFIKTERPQFNYYEFEGIPYGLYIDDDNFDFSPWLTFDTKRDYCLVLNAKSVNLGPYSQTGKTSNALIAFEILTEAFACE